MERGEVGERGWGECSVNGEDGERLPSKLSSAVSFKTLTEGAVTTKDGSLSQYFITLTKKPTLSFSGGSHLGIP